MRRKAKVVYRFSLAIIFVLSMAVSAVAEESAAHSRALKNQTDLVEKFPQFSSVINWTTGEIVTEVEQPLSEFSPNLGQTVNRNEVEVRDELRQNLIKAIGSVRITDIYNIKEYSSGKSEVRYEIMAKVDKAFYYPVTMTGGKFVGKAKLDFYGKEGVANIFFRDVERAPQTTILADERKITESYDGMVLDMVQFPEFKPSIQFRIYNEKGDLLYGPETVDREVMERSGVCEYTTSLSNAFLSPRSGHRLFYAIPLALKGRMNTYVVLKNSDAEKIFQNPRTLFWMKKGNVVIVKPLQ